MALSRVLIVSIAANLMNCLKLLFLLENISMPHTSSLPVQLVGLPEMKVYIFLLADPQETPTQPGSKDPQRGGKGAGATRDRSSGLDCWATWLERA